MKVFITMRPRSIGGGSNSFASLFCRYARQAGHRLVRQARRADLAVVIAHKALEADLEAARDAGCTILHRIDEYFEPVEPPGRREKHATITRLNRFADMTVFQSRFVFENVAPYVRPQRHCIIHNGGDPAQFRPAAAPGNMIGHVTWSIHARKRLDLLREFIRAHPQERFLLVGRHRESDTDLHLPNVVFKGRVRRWRLPRLLRKLKLLFHPAEKDPCPNTVVEAILSGVPVCYHPEGGTVELVRDCGEPLERADALLESLPQYRARCLRRPDLDFAQVYAKYMAAAEEVMRP
jgi:glycosyltransferase involved in cell wall biosynthesis